MRAAGTAMVDAGISDGDVLLVDRAVTAAHGAVIIAVVQGELLCRRLEREPGRARGTPAMRLVAANGVTAPIALGPEAPLEVWGVVTTVIKTLTF
jgi:DNA polymerase V